MKYIMGIFGIVAMSFASCYYDKEENLYPIQACDSTKFTFALQVKPLLQTQCLGCHSQSAASGNVILETYTQVKTYASNGKLIGTISHNSGFSAMPKNGNKLNDCDILLVKKWVTAGALNN